MTLAKPRPTQNWMAKVINFALFYSFIPFHLLIQLETLLVWTKLWFPYHWGRIFDDFCHNSSNTIFNCKSHTFCSFSTPSIFNCLLHHECLRPDWCELNSGFHILFFSFIVLQLNFVKELHVIILFDKTEQN